MKVRADINAEEILSVAVIVVPIMICIVLILKGWI
jgi:hypothetical protein